MHLENMRSRNPHVPKRICVKSYFPKFHFLETICIWSLGKLSIGGSEDYYTKKSCETATTPHWGKDCGVDYTTEDKKGNRIYSNGTWGDYSAFGYVKKAKGMVIMISNNGYQRSSRTFPTGLPGEEIMFENPLECLPGV